MTFTRLFGDYARYAASGMDSLIFRHSNWMRFLASLQNSPLFSVVRAGDSAEGRSIWQLSWGKGPVPVLFWSQMHGNESTASRSLCDLFQFLSACNDAFQPLRDSLSQRFTLHFLPMLNPDGAERWQRENGLGIDLNRDALRRTAPESQILYRVFGAVQPRIGFNLHDQSDYYSVGNSLCPATLTLLAPPSDSADSVSSGRLLAMALVGYMYDVTGTLFPGYTAKWRDDFEPRAFGEFFQQAGMATVLIEAGGFPADPNRNVARRLIFSLLLSSLAEGIPSECADCTPSSLASWSKAHREPIVTRYQSIALNRENGMFSRIEREKTIEYNQCSYITDVGYRRQYHFLNGVLEGELIPEATGDLRMFGSYEECQQNTPAL